MKKLTFTLNGKKIEFEKGETVLQAAKRAGYDIPNLCYHSDLKVKANCRICVVEIAGRKGLETSCSTKAEPGMKVITRNARIDKARRTNLELIFAQHREECADCVYKYNCDLLKYADQYKAKRRKYKDRKSDDPTYKFGPALEFDSSKCIDCRNCVEMCEKQNVNFLEVKEKGHLHKVVPTSDSDKDCIYCGQCLVHCPVGAFEGAGEFEEIEKLIKRKNKVVVFQFAPSIRTSIGEEFNMPHGSVVTGKLIAAIRKLGVKYVFDTSVGADFTTVEEARELAERLTKNQKLPMFTSCCPGWVKYVELFEPRYIPNLTTARSPHMMLGGLIKTYWAREMGINPKDVFVVSVMPCIAKKYEAQRAEMKIDGNPPVDRVITNRELAFLLKKHNIDLKKIKAVEESTPLGTPSGAGVIYGASGGVMESALRTAYYQLTGKKPSRLKFKDVRGMTRCKTAEVKINDRIVRVAVANGMENAAALLEQLKKDPHRYDYIEVMACPGGCIGGGGQPVPTNKETRRKRAEALYSVDTKKKIFMAHENPSLQEIYQTFLADKHTTHKIFHTTYQKKKREVKKP
ncbi:[FeFe] hydrogenase, group A [Patescibacteria group bacterium]